MPALYAMLIPMTSALTVPWLKIPNMGGLITVHKKRWETPPCGGQFGKNVYFHARIPSDTAEIGGCGLEVVKVGADGLENSDNDLRKRAVLSGTLFVSERFRRQGVAQRLLLEVTHISPHLSTSLHISPHLLPFDGLPRPSLSLSIALVRAPCPAPGHLISPNLTTYHHISPNLTTSLQILVPCPRPKGRRGGGGWMR